MYFVIHHADLFTKGNKTDGKETLKTENNIHW